MKDSVIYKIGSKMKCLVFLSTASIVFSLSASAASFTKPVEGRLAKQLFELGGDGSGNSTVGSTELSGGCHYRKAGNTFELVMCDSEVGFINSPVRDSLSNLLLANRKPKRVEDGRWVIGVHFVCLRLPKYSCSMEDLEDYKQRDQPAAPATSETVN